MTVGHARLELSGSGDEIGALASSLIVSSLTDESKTEMLTWALQQVMSRDSARGSFRDSVPSILEQTVAVALDKKMGEIAREMVETGYPDLEARIREHIDKLIGGLVGDDDSLRDRIRMAVMRELSTD